MTAIITGCCISAIAKRGVSVKFLMSSEATHKDRMVAHFQFLMRKYGDKVQVKFFQVRGNYRPIVMLKSQTCKAQC